MAAESQDGWPTFTVKQPGLKVYSVGLLKVTDTHFKIAFTVKSGGSRGTIRITITGKDINGGTDTQTLTIPLN